MQENAFQTSPVRNNYICDACGCEDIGDGDDGFYYCSQCGSQNQNYMRTETDLSDFFCGVKGISGTIYSAFRQRIKVRTFSAESNARFLPKEEILGSLTRSAAGSPKKESAVSACKFEEPQDFGLWTCSEDPEKVVRAIRLHYVQGLQLMLQLQCDVLVQKFGVNSLICGTAMTVWLRYVAVSRVFYDSWVERMIDEAEVAASAKFIEKDEKVDPAAVIDRKEKQETQMKKPFKFRMQQSKTFEQKTVSVSFRSLRKMIPIYSTLSISFLSCHLAREAVLPTDIYNWVSESKLPYLSAFAELEKYLGAPKFCPLSSRILFRPTRIISASFLEGTAASIAQIIGLRTPSVNFYAIAQRYLKVLSLPLAKILPHACHLYEWSLPSELWLSSCHWALPTRAYVMSILIVTIRILYNIHGQGIWERSLYVKKSYTSFGLKHHCVAQEDNATGPSVSVDLSCSQNFELSAKELLQILDTVYHGMNTAHEYSMDLRSYLKYCGDVIYAGLNLSYEEGKLVDRLWDLYDKQEDNDLQVDENANFISMKAGKRPRSAEESKRLPSNTKKANLVRHDASVHEETCTLPKFPAALRDAAVEHLKFEMEDDGFQYLPPMDRKKGDISYLHYKNQKIDGKLVCLAHADYYILLRACAKLAQVDSRVLHMGVLKFENKLSWIEGRIDQSLIDLLQKASIQCGN